VIRKLSRLYENGDPMKSKETLLLRFFSKISFLLFLFSQVFFSNTIINQFAILFMSAMVGLLCLTYQRVNFHSYFLFTLLLVIQSYVLSINGVSINPENSLDMTSTIAINLMVCLIIYNYIIITNSLEESLFSFVKVVVMFTIFIVVLSIPELFSGRLGTNISFNILGREIRYNANSIAIVTGVSFLILIYQFYKTKNKFILLTLPWLLLTILLTGSRKGFLLIFIGTPLLILLFNPKNKLRNGIVGIIITAFLYWLVMNIPFLYNILGYRLEAITGILTDAELEEASMNTRHLLTKRGWEYFLSSIWEGYGLDNFRNLPGSYGTYSHNNYIELMVSGGLPAIFFFYSIRFIVLFRLFLLRNRDQMIKLLFVITLLMLILDYGLVSYFERIYLLYFVFAISGLTILKNRTKHLNK